MKTKLHDVTGKNRFCGPTAIATICGITTDDASRVVRSVTGKHSVCAMSDRQMVDALQSLGCTVEYHKVAGLPTANQWILANKAVFKHHHVILVHGHHFGTLLENEYLCSLTEKRMAVGLHEIPKRKARVAAYFVVKSLPDQIGAISHEHYPLKPRLPSTRNDIKLVGYGLGALQDDPESSSWPTGKTIPLSRSEYFEFERAMQWPDELAEYDKLRAQSAHGALPV